MNLPDKPSQLKYLRKVLRRIRRFMQVSERAGCINDYAYRYARRCGWAVENDIQELERKWK